MLNTIVDIWIENSQDVSGLLPFLGLVGFGSIMNISEASNLLNKFFLDVDKFARQVLITLYLSPFLAFCSILFYVMTAFKLFLFLGFFFTFLIPISISIFAGINLVWIIFPNLREREIMKQLENGMFLE